MSDYKPNLYSDLNPGRRQFLFTNVPDAVLAGYAVKTGIITAVIELFWPEPDWHPVLKRLIIRVFAISKND